MKSLKTILAATTLSLMSASAYAATIDISVQQDTTLGNTQPDNNYGGNPYWLWMGDNGNRDYQVMFGFDMSALTSLVGQGEQLVINSMSFNAYNSYGDDTGPVNIGLGNNDNWDEFSVTYNSHGSDHGGALDSQIVSSSTVNSYVSWDVSTVGANEFMQDNYLTFFMFIPNPGTGDNWHNFEPEEHGSSHEAFLNIDYTIAAVPEPSTYALMLGGLGLIGLMARRRKA